MSNSRRLTWTFLPIISKQLETFSSLYSYSISFKTLQDTMWETMEEFCAFAAHHKQYVYIDLDSSITIDIKCLSSGNIKYVSVRVGRGNTLYANLPTSHAVSIL